MVELKKFNVFDYLTTMEDCKEYIKVLHQEMEKMEYERQPLPDWSTLLAEKDAEIKRLRTTLRIVADWADYSNKTKWTMTSALHNANVIARAALTPLSGATHMTPDDLIERVALRNCKDAVEMGRLCRTACTPCKSNAREDVAIALEEAARVADAAGRQATNDQRRWDVDAGLLCQDIAAAIRAMIPSGNNTGKSEGE